MTSETKDQPSPKEKADLEDTLAQVDKVRKQLREDAVPISQAEEAARNDRIRMDWAADGLDRVYIDLVALRNSEATGLAQWLNQIRTTVSSAGYSGYMSAKGYSSLQPVLTDARTLTSGAVASVGTTGYLSTEAYFDARKRDASLDPEPPSTKCPPPLYVEEAATSDQRELDALLIGLTHSLFEKLSGARAALAGRQVDYVAHAHQSMQELLDQVLHHFADDIDNGKDGRVKKAPWWKPDPNVKNEVTRAHRVRFVVQGYAERVDPETDRRIEDLIGLARTLSGIQAEKHRHGGGGEESLARKHLTALEGFLLYLLRNHRPDLLQTPANSHD